MRDVKKATSFIEQDKKLVIPIDAWDEEEKFEPFSLNADNHENNKQESADILY